MEIEHGKTGVVSTSDQTRLLAIGSLFGLQFLNEADPDLINSIQQNPEAWGDFVQAVWRISRLDVQSAPAVPSGSNSHVLPPPATPEPAQTAVVGVPEGRKEPPVPTSADLATSPPAESSPSPSPLAIFDPEVDPPVAAPPAKDVSREEIRKYLVDIIVKKTGYPAETFEEPLDFEADLGIDSIKQVEALGEVRQHFQLPLDENFRMRDYSTIDAATDYIVRRLKGDPLESPSEPGKDDEAASSVESPVYL
jgi:acyl carrier protein